MAEMEPPDRDLWEPYEERVRCPVHSVWVTLGTTRPGMPEWLLPECEGCVTDALAEEAEVMEGWARQEGRL